MSTVYRPSLSWVRERVPVLSLTRTRSMDSLPVLRIRRSRNLYCWLSTVTFSNDALLWAVLSSMTVSEIVVLI